MTDNDILTYGKNHLPVQDNRTKQIHIFGSSSKGNSIYFKDGRFLIDLGFPYKVYQKYDFNFFLKTDFIFLTHEHTDHLNPATMFRILENYPAVKFIISRNMWEDMLNPEFAHRLNQKKLVSYNKHFYLAQPFRITNHKGMNIDFIPHVTAHGPINNCAIEITYNDKHLLYASDLDEYQANPARGTQGLPMDKSNPFDVLCLEANYDANILYNWLRIHPFDFRAKQNLRHTSEQDAWNYADKFLKPDGIFIPLHASKTFGTLLQHSDTDKH